MSVLPVVIRQTYDLLLGRPPLLIRIYSKLQDDIQDDNQDDYRMMFSVSQQSLSSLSKVSQQSLKSLSSLSVVSQQYVSILSALLKTVSQLSLKAILKHSS